MRLPSNPQEGSAAENLWIVGGGILNPRPSRHQYTIWHILNFILNKLFIFTTSKPTRRHFIARGKKTPRETTGHKDQPGDWAKVTPQAGENTPRWNFFAPQCPAGEPIWLSASRSGCLSSPLVYSIDENLNVDGLGHVFLVSRVSYYTFSQQFRCSCKHSQGK